MCITLVPEKLPQRHGDTVNLISYIQVPALINRGRVGGRARHYKKFIYFAFLKTFPRKFTWFSIVLLSFLCNSLFSIKDRKK